MNSRRLLALFIMSMVAISACQNIANQPSNDTVSAVSSNPADCRTIEHEQGETEICGQPQRIVVLGPYVLEPLLALDVQPVGYGDHIAFHQGDYTDPSQQIPYLGDLVTQPLVNVGLAHTPSTETILKIKPDLILGLDMMNADEYETLSRIAPTLLLDYYKPAQNLRAIAQTANRTEQAEQLLSKIAQQITTAREAFAPLVATHPKMLLLSSSRLQEFNLGNSGHGLCSSLIEELGFQLVAPSGFDGSSSESVVPISIETLPQLNEADSVIMLGSNFSPSKQTTGDEQFEADQLADIKQSWQENTITQSLDASKAGRVYFIPEYLCLGLPGPIGTGLYLEELKEQLLTPN